MSIFSALCISKDKQFLYACTTPETYNVSKFEQDKETKTWKKVEDLPRTDNNTTETMLQLKLDMHDKVLFGK